MTPSSGPPSPLARRKRTLADVVELLAASADQLLAEPRPSSSSWPWSSSIWANGGPSSRGERRRVGRQADHRRPRQLGAGRLERRLDVARDVAGGSRRGRHADPRLLRSVSPTSAGIGALGEGALALELERAARPPRPARPRCRPRGSRAGSPRYRRGRCRPARRRSGCRRRARGTPPPARPRGSGRYSPRTTLSFSQSRSTRCSRAGCVRTTIVEQHANAAKNEGHVGEARAPGCRAGSRPSRPPGSRRSAAG